MRTLLRLLLALALGCSKPAPGPAPITTTPTTTAAASSAEPASPTTATSAAEAPSAAPSASAPAASSGAAAVEPSPVPAGTYRSASCGTRKYARVVHLSAPNKIQMDDLVSPCPPGARCMWSGIVVRTGTYSVVSGKHVGAPMRLALTLTKDPRSEAPPPHLLWWNSRGELSEPDEKCLYKPEP
jgi:hypothetical protein